MITDKETNRVYFSKRIQWRKIWKDTVAPRLIKAGVTPVYLEATKDIWVRDFMPIQISENQFVTYQYNPDYLQEEKYQHLKSDWESVYRSSKDLLPDMQIIKTDLIIDGGNVIKCGDKIIMTDKLIQENRRINKTRKEIIHELDRVFNGAELIFIPWNTADEWDYCGHVDSMVRCVDNDTVLINNFCNHAGQTWLREEILDILKGHQLQVEEMDLSATGKKYHGVNDWAYLNFLRIGNKIFMPQVSGPNQDFQEEDELAEKKLETYYPECKIFPINLLPIIKANGKYGGGAFNCISWNIYCN